MTTIDLHSHSTASDGTCLPDEVLKLAKDVNIDMFALTDHDTTLGYQKALPTAKALGVRLISGVEISTQHAIVGGYGVKQTTNKSIHIVGLNFADIDKMENALQAVQTARANRGRAMATKMAEILADDDFFNKDHTAVSVIDERLWRAVLAKTNGNEKSVGRPHIGAVLHEWGIVASVSQAFDKYLADDKPAYVALQSLSIKQAIDLIHDCGGFAVLAHPTRYGLSATRVRKLLADFAELGGDGCELPAPSEPVSTRAMIDREIAKHNLLVSVGSDFHGTTTPWRKLGQVSALKAGQIGVWERF